MSKHILYGNRYARSLITEAVLIEGGIDYQLREIDISSNEHTSREYLKINPTGLVPTLVTPEGEVLYECPAINLFLVDRYKVISLAPGVDDPDRGQFLSSLFYITGEIEPAMKRYFYPYRYGVSESDSETIKKLAMIDVLKRFSVIDQKIEKSGPFQLGKRLSLADITLAYWVACSDPELFTDKFPSLGGCVERILNRPGIKHLFDDLRRDLIAYRK